MVAREELLRLARAARPDLQGTWNDLHDGGTAIVCILDATALVALVSIDEHAAAEEALYRALLALAGEEPPDVAALRQQLAQARAEAERHRQRAHDLSNANLVLVGYMEAAINQLVREGNGDAAKVIEDAIAKAMPSLRPKAEGV